MHHLYGFAVYLDYNIMFAGFGLGVVMVCHPFFYYLPNLNYIYGMALVKKQWATLPGVKHWGFLHTPDDKTKKYPVVFSFHGNGELGSTSASADSILRNGPLYQIKSKGWNPQDLIVWGMQHHTWSFPFQCMEYAIANNTDIKSIWDGRVIVYGLSAGGEEVHKVMLQMHKPQYGYVMDSPAIKSDSNYPAGVKFVVWAFIGDKDTVVQGGLAGVRDLAKDVPDARIIITPNQGHTGWNTHSDPNYRINNENIYEFIQNRIPLAVTNTIPPVVVPPVVLPPVTPEPPIPVPEITEDIAYLDTKNSGKVEIKIKKVNGVWQP